MSKKMKKLSVPRSMEEIQLDYQRMCANAGQLQYQLRIQSKELEMINQRLEAVNNEAAARNKLDQEAKASQATVDAAKSTEAKVG